MQDNENKKDKMISFRVNRRIFNFLKSIPKRGMSRFLEISIMRSLRYDNYMRGGKNDIE